MGVRHQGQGAGQHSVWNGRTSRKNNLLVIHDSGGFEAAETSNLEEIKRFIAYCAGMAELERQLHCIWHVPSLSMQLFRANHDQVLH